MLICCQIDVFEMLKITQIWGTYTQKYCFSSIQMFLWQAFPLIYMLSEDAMSDVIELHLL